MKNLLLILATIAIAFAQRCVQHVEWRELSPNAQDAYLNAVLCLRNTSSKLSVGSPSFFDDFVYVHMRANLDAHGTVRPLVIIIYIL